MNNHSEPKQLNKSGGLWSLFPAALMMIATISIQAQEDGDEPVEGSKVLEEIIVTAQRRETTLFETPQSVMVLTEQDILMQGLTEFTDYVHKLPGVTYVDRGIIPVFGANDFFIRGLVSSGTAAMYLDELSLGSTYQPRLDDVARVEVLRGPQGTLYGEGTMGGAIRVITNKPVLQELSGRFKIGGSTIHGGTQGFLAEGVVNFPIGETVAVRASAYYEDRPAFADALPFEHKAEILATDPGDPLPSYIKVRRNANGSSQAGARAAIRWQPTEKLAITLMSMIQSSKMANDPGVAVELLDRKQYAQFRFFDYDVNLDFKAYNLTIEYELPFATLMSSTSVSSQEYKSFGDVTFFIRFLSGLFGIPQPDKGIITYDFPRDRTVQEVRLVSTHGGPWSWVVGGFYLDAKNDITLGLFAEPDPLPPIAGTFLLTNFVQKPKQKAVFGELTYRFFDRLDATLGLRYVDQEVATTKRDSGLLGNPPEDTLFESTDLLTKFWLTYTVSDTARLYGGRSEGFRQGVGLPALPPSCLDALEEILGTRVSPAQVDPDFVTNYELGWKQELAQNRVQYSVAAFQIDWDDVQTTVGLGCGFNTVINSGKTQIRGVEFDAAALVTDAFTVTLAGAYTDTEIKDSFFESLKGGVLGVVPEWHLSVSANYEFPVFSGNTGYLYGDYQYMSARPWGGPLDELPEYNMVDLRAGVNTKNIAYQLYIRNVTNEFIVTGQGLNIPGELRVVATAPREIGISATWIF